MAEQALFDLRRADAIAGGLDHVVEPRFEPEIALFVHPGQVAGAQPILTELLSCRVRAIPVVKKHGRMRRPDYDLTQFTGICQAAVITPDSGLGAGVSPTHRPTPERPATAAMADHKVGLGLSVALVQMHAKGGAAAVKQARLHRL